MKFAAESRADKNLKKKIGRSSPLGLKFTRRSIVGAGQLLKSFEIAEATGLLKKSKKYAETAENLVTLPPRMVFIGKNLLVQNQNVFL